jgi:hypothetical protein
MFSLLIHAILICFTCCCYKIPMLPDPRGLDTGSVDPRFGSGSESGSGQIHAGSANTTFPLLRETDLPGRKWISTRPTPRARIQKAFSWVLGFFYSFIFLSSVVVLKGARPHFEGNSLFVCSQGASVKILEESLQSSLSRVGAVSLEARGLGPPTSTLTAWALISIQHLRFTLYRRIRLLIFTVFKFSLYYL